MQFFRPRYLTLAAADVACAVTVAAMVVPTMQFAYRSGMSHTMLETATAMIAVIAAYLVYGRFKHTGRITDLFLLGALSFLSLPKFIVPFVAPSIAGDSTRFSAWAMLVATVVGSGLFAVAATVPERRLARPALDARLLLGGSVAGAVLLAYLVAALSSRLPLGLDPTTMDAHFPHFAEVPSIVALQLAGMIFFGVAAVGFVRRAEWSGDEFTSWLAASASIGAFARLNYLFFPSLYPEWVYPADFLRLAAFLLILVAAMREINRYRQGLATAAILEERRRMARELHDGLAQELSFIVTKSRALAEGFAEPTQAALGRVAGAAERALDESRRAITALSAPMDESLEAALAQTVEEVANRVGARAEIFVDPDVTVPSATKEALLRIVREAVTNASRHGGANRVRVQLSNGNVLRLTVSDDGSGFDPVAVARESDGFGLTTMTERVHALGGELRISSRPSAGTEIEVVLP